MATVSKDTKSNILDAAERLFAARGFEGTSLRSITTEARVNLAAVNYHFQSKDALIQAVISRRLAPINHKRLEMLAACQAASRNGPPPVQAIIRALVIPPLELITKDPGGCRRLMGRVFSEPGEFVERVIGEQFGQVLRQFCEAFRLALPEMPPEVLAWRIHFMIGAMAHTLSGTQVLRYISGGSCDPSDVEESAKQLLAFLLAGLRAPAPLRKRTKVKHAK